MPKETTAPAKRRPWPVRLWKRAPVLTTALLCALGISAFFLVRLTMSAIYWGDAAHRDVPLEPWMTPRYIAHSWSVPPKVMIEALALDATERGRRINLDQLARKRGVPVEALISAVQTAIADHRTTAP